MAARSWREPLPQITQVAPATHLGRHVLCSCLRTEGPRKPRRAPSHLHRLTYQGDRSVVRPSSPTKTLQTEALEKLLLNWDAPPPQLPAPLTAQCHDEAVRASFRHELSAVEAAVRAMRQFRADAIESAHKERVTADHLEALLHDFDALCLAGTPLKKPRLADIQDVASAATPTEVACCAALLNLQRWLCGLPPVRLEELRLELCDAVSQALLPREAVVASSESSNQVAQRLGSLNVSILHGEASLVVAIEQSLGCCGLVPPQGVVGGIFVPARKSSDELSVLAPFQALFEADALPKRPRSSERPRPGRRRRPQGPQRNPPQESQHGLHTIWADRRGALDFRRCLLNPALEEFGAARRQDTCVLWSGSRLDGEHSSRPSARPDAVCYPPTGFVPIWLLQHGRVPWTIMPDNTRFQPTAETAVRAWRVRISGDVAERQEEVEVRGCAVDCSTRGEPFCVVFWPALPRRPEGLQLELVLSGLCGVASELRFFYELHALLQADLDRHLQTEAARARTLLRDPALWSTPQPVPGLSSFQTLSHHELAFVTNSVDVTLTLCVPGVPAVTAQLLLSRFGQDEEEVPNGAQVQRLPLDHFIVRVKLPMAHARYELCLTAEGQKGELRYQITTSESCPTLLSSIDHPLLRKFGYAVVTSEAQRHGVLVLSPETRRIVVGACYFLIHVDKERLLANAYDTLKAAQLGAGGAGPVAQAQSSLVSERLGLTATPLDGDAPGVSPFQRHLCAALGRRTQDSGSEIHIDLLRGDDCVARLDERQDLPGVFDGTVTFSAADEGTSVQLVLRCPQLHAVEFAPKKLCEWLVVRSEHFPINF